jgi:hypothetical protein
VKKPPIPIGLVAGFDHRAVLDVVSTEETCRTNTGLNIHEVTKKIHGYSAQYVE